MRNRKRFIQIVCIILVLLMLLSISVMVIAPTVYASSEEIQNEIDSLSYQQSEIQGRMDQLQAEIDSLDFEKANTLEKKEYLDQKNMLAQEELNVIQEQIDIIDGKIATIQNDLSKAREEEQAQEKQWLARLRAMEESSGIGYMDVLFDATSFSDLLTRLDMVNEVMAYDEELENEYIAARENVETLEAEAEVMFRENADRRAELETKKGQLETDITAACALIEQMDQNTDEYEEILEQEAATQAQITALIVQKEDELAQARAVEEAARQAALAAQQAEAQQQGQQAPPSADGEGDDSSSGSGDSSSSDSGSSNSGSSSSSSGNSSSGTWMMWPSYTRYLTDHYGPRPVHPVTGKSTFHDGVDIGASYGTSIYAAASGKVILASTYGGYGNCVMVNHGNGYTTLYGHMSSISVTNGQSVSQGQVLGLVGATGVASGPHLHFEVRSSASGTPMDPMSFTYF